MKKEIVRMIEIYKESLHVRFYKNNLCCKAITFKTDKDMLNCIDLCRKFYGNFRVVIIEKGKRYNYYGKEN